MGTRALSRSRKVRSSVTFDARQAALERVADRKADPAVIQRRYHHLGDTDPLAQAVEIVLRVKKPIGRHRRARPRRLDETEQKKSPAVSRMAKARDHSYADHAVALICRSVTPIGQHSALENVSTAQ